MLTILNLIVILLVLLIAYWWANQGVFSALLHLLCTLAAGAMAIAIWEPFADTMLGTDNQFLHGIAWGVALIVPYVVFLLIFRVACDKVAPNNMNFPTWVDYTVGGLAGWGAGTISVGILALAMGFTQGGISIMGYRGWQRTNNQAQQAQLTGMWYPVHSYTVKVYDFLSSGALSTSTPLRQYNPQLHRQASLFRDTYEGGDGKVAMPPDAAEVQSFSVMRSEDGPDVYFVTVRFADGAIDFGERLTMTSSQIRLVEAVGGSTQPRVLHPVAWRQPHSGVHRFDSIQNSVTNESGKQSLVADFAFELPPGFNTGSPERPALVLIRNNRYTLPALGVASPQLARDFGGIAETGEMPDAVAIDSAITINNAIRGLNVTANDIPGSMDRTDDLYLTSGRMTVGKGRSLVGGRAVRIKGIYEPDGAVLVKVNVKRGSICDLFAFQTFLPDNAVIRLIDADGDEYTPIGYVYQNGAEFRINLDPAGRMPNFDDINDVPGTGPDEDLDLLFYVTEGAQITGLKVGEETVGFSNVRARRGGRR